MILLYGFLIGIYIHMELNPEQPALSDPGLAGGQTAWSQEDLSNLSNSVILQLYEQQRQGERATVIH